MTAETKAQLPCPCCMGEQGWWVTDKEWAECSVYSATGSVTTAPLPDEVEADIGTVECIGRCLGGSFERDLLAHSKRIRAHMAAMAEQLNAANAEGRRVTVALGNEMMKTKEQYAEIERLRGALDGLIAVQNGPPLIRYEREYNAAMERAQEALAPKHPELDSANPPKTRDNAAYLSGADIKIAARVCESYMDGESVKLINGESNLEPVGLNSMTGKGGES